MWIFFHALLLSFSKISEAVPNERETQNAIRAFKQSQFLQALADPFPHEEREQKESSSDEIPFCVTTWGYFLDSMTYDDGVRLRPNIASLLHRNFTQYIKDWSRDSKKREYLEQKSRKTGEFDCFEDAVLHLIDKIYDWLEGQEVTEICFFPSAFFELDGSLKHTEQESAFWRNKYRPQILSQFERALRLAGPQLALALGDTPHHGQGNIEFGPSLSESFLLIPQGGSVFENGKRMLLYKSFQKIYGTFSKCAAICQKPKGQVLEALARAVYLQFLYVNKRVDFESVSVFFDEWMSEKGHAVELFKSSILTKMLDIPPKVQKSYHSCSFLKMLAWVSVYSLRSYMDASVAADRLDPITWHYVDLKDTDVLQAIQDDGRAFFQYLFPVLLKWKESIAEIFDTLGLPEAKIAFMKKMDVASKVEKRLENPSFRWTLKLENRYPLQMNTPLNQMTQGCSTHIELPLCIWLPLIKKHVEHSSE